MSTLKITDLKSGNLGTFGLTENEKSRTIEGSILSYPSLYETFIITPQNHDDFLKTQGSFFKKGNSCFLNALFYNKEIPIPYDGYVYIIHAENFMIQESFNKI